MSNLPERFGSAVRHRRAELGVTLDQLAGTSGVTAGTLSRIERGTLNPSLTSAAQIAAGLSVDLGQLLAQDEPSVRRLADAPTVQDAAGIRRIGLASPRHGSELLRYELPPGARTRDFAPHARGTIETFHLISGSLEVYGGPEPLRLESGDTAVAAGDQPHAMHNPAEEAAIVLLLISRPA